MADPYSDYKIVWHTEKLLSLKENKITSPINILIQPTNKCSHNCFYCSYKHKYIRDINTNDEISWKTLSGLIRDASDMGVKSITISGGGEPLMHPNIKELVYLIQKNNMQYALMTNAQYLFGDIAKHFYDASWVRVSLDSYTGDIFEKIRGIDEKYFYEIVENISNFSMNKSRSCELGINFVINKLNYTEIGPMALWANTIGCGHIKFTALVSCDPNYHNRIRGRAIKEIQKAKIHEYEKFKIIDKYSQDFSDALTNKRPYTFCPMMQINTVIGADSKVYMCHDKSGVKNGVIGDLTKQSFKKIWFGAKDKFNTNVQKNCQQHCVHDARNVFINKLLKTGLDIDYV